MLSWIEYGKQLIWSPPMLLAVVGTGLLLSISLRGLQFRYLGYGLRLALFSTRDSDEEGDISHFKALMTSLAGAVGTGSIVGMAVGVSTGGFGALFWMWVTALVGMATKFSEALMAVKYRQIDHRGEMIGGPMHYIEHGTGMHWLALLFALFGAIAALGTGNLVQINSIGDAAHELMGINPWVVGGVLAAVTAFVLVGGVRSIGNVAGVLVPVMAIIYVGGGCIILAKYYEAIPAAFGMIFREAFTGKAVAGGAAGSAFILAIQMGVSKGVFTNEAGLGISSIAAAAAKTDHPGRQAVVAMTGTFLSTLIICTITGLVLAVTDVIGSCDASGEPLKGARLSICAFDQAMWGGKYVATIGLILFAYSTALGWAYYGEKCCEYLLGEGSVNAYRLLYSLLVIPGAAVDLDIVWDIADISNGLMIIPNVIGLLALRKIIKSEASDFEALVRSEGARL